MTWNYRLILHDLDPDPDRHWIGLHEVYYDPIGWTEKAIDFVCDVDEGPEGIIQSLERALKDARERPMLKESELEAQIKARAGTP